MIHFKIQDKETKKIKKVVFIDFESQLIKTSDGELTDFRHSNLLMKKGDKWINV